MEKSYEETALEVALQTRRLDTVLARLHLQFAALMGLTPHEVLALEHLGMDGPLGPSELGQRLRITTGAVTALVDRLAERGFVRREPHPHDRRRLSIHITQTGEDTLMLRLRPMFGEIGALVQSMSREERATTARFLAELSSIIEKHAVGWASSHSAR